MFSRITLSGLESYWQSSKLDADEQRRLIPMAIQPSRRVNSKTEKQQLQRIIFENTTTLNPSANLKEKKVVQIKDC